MTAALLAASGAAHVLVRCVVAVLDMVWMTLWALLFGFLVSGAVQRFATSVSLQQRLGDHTWRSVARATSYGAASSSCSYAAAATSRSLLARGADAVSAFVFMVASTNLVIELGAMILGLLGWRFLGAQLVGGLALVALLALVGGRFLRGPVVDRARVRLAAAPDAGVHDCQTHDAQTHDAQTHDAQTHDAQTHDAQTHNAQTHNAQTHNAQTHNAQTHNAQTHNAQTHNAQIDDGQTHDDRASADPGEDRAPLRSLEGWSDAAGLGLADARMVRRELLVGFLLAGVVSVVVPERGWSALFLHGHGAWTTLENALLAPVIAALSCVCSVGNVPLAATLWRSGIGFTGTLAFLFADVLAIPLLLVYRRYYGTGLALRLVAVLYLVIVASALLVGGVFDAVGLAPSHVGTSVALGAGGTVTAVLNLVALATVGALLAARARRRRDKATSSAASAASLAG